MLSVAVHVAAVAGAIYATGVGTIERPRPPKGSVTFVASALPRLAFHESGSLPARPDTRLRPVVHPVEAPRPKPPEPLPGELAVVEPFAMPAPTSAVDAADDSQMESRPRTVVGAFDQPAGNNPLVARPGVVRSAGFGSAATSQPSKAVQASLVRSGTFDRQAAPPSPPASPPPPPARRADSPVEILFKPKPAYTDEARTLGVEGSVILEIEFTAAAEVRVLRVLNALGHGLDEAAALAARQIRFKPARAAGSPVGVRTTVHIEFRLT